MIDPYNEQVMKHFIEPKNVGKLMDADGIGSVGDPDCGDLFVIYIKVKDALLDVVKFQTFGCPAAIATCSVLTEMALGKTLEEAYRITDDDVVHALMGLPDPKIHCSTGAAGALHNAIDDYAEKQRSAASQPQFAAPSGNSQ